MTHSIPRRSFVKYGSLAMTAMALSYPVRTGQKVNDKIRIGIIGTGQRGTGLASEIQKLDEYELIACCDILPENLQEGMSYAARGAKGYDDYRELLANRDVDAVIISTPLYLHYPMALDAIDARKHIYCEKTMVYNIEQSLDLYRHVEESDLIFQVGFQYRNYPLYQVIKAGVEAGDLGEVKHFICHYNRNNDWRRTVANPDQERLINWRMYREYSGGVTAELSAHQIDILNWMFDGPPKRITGFGSVNHWKDGREIFDNINLVFDYPAHITGIVSCHLCNEHQAYIVKLIGTRGTVEIHRDKAFYQPEATAFEQAQAEKGVIDGVSGATLIEGKGEYFPIPVTFEEGYTATTYALKAFAESIYNSTTPNSNIQTGKESAIAVDMANRAMEKNRIEEWLPEYNS
jgi:predicted dehydrogenase